MKATISSRREVLVQAHLNSADIRVCALIGVLICIVPLAVDAGEHANDPQSGTPKPAAVSASVRESPFKSILQLSVDASDTERRVFGVEQTLSVEPGELTLLFPQWIPGYHAPVGPITSIAGLEIRADGQRLAWSRNPRDVFALNLIVPPRTSELNIRFQVLTPLVPEQWRVVMTPEMLNLQWHSVLLYPAGYRLSEIAVAVNVVFPEGWEIGTSLNVASREGPRVRFEPCSLERLVDSPVFAGAHFKRLDLDPGSEVPVHLSLFADTAKSLQFGPGPLEAHRRLVRQAYSLFGAPHFDRYEFLLALSDRLGDIGLEHSSSSENLRPPSFFSEWETSPRGRALLPHEFVHAWNGKFRWPTALGASNLNTPVEDTLLWIYEGLTSYWAFVLSARSGFWTTDFALQVFAGVVADQDRNRPGRAWRTLEDTTHQPLLMPPAAPEPWPSWQRSHDYYMGGLLLWLEVDSTIRELTRNQRSLDHFAATFFGMPARESPQRSYDFDEIVMALSAIAPYDWAGLLHARLRGLDERPAAHFERTGWQLVYRDQPSGYLLSREAHEEIRDFTFSMGLVVSEKQDSEGEVTEVLWGGPAFEAGIVPGSRIVAVNGGEYSGELLEASITHAASKGDSPITLLVKSAGRYRSAEVRGTGALQYPWLERVPDSPDQLGRILRPRQ